MASLLARVVLYLSGVFGYVAFFAGGNLSLTSLDWAKEMAYQDTLRVAMATRVLPWQWNVPFAHASNKFLANPEVTLTPDILLLAWLPNTTFTIVHVVILYSLGFVGLLLLARRFKFSFGAMLIFWVLLNFNGHVISHLAVGHFQWTGYFLLPLFFYLLFRFGDESTRGEAIFSRTTLSMSMLFGFLLLNGSVHVYVWCAMFMVCALLWQGRMLPRVVASIAVGGLLGAGRLLPAALFFPTKGEFKSGYPNLGTLVDAFTADLGVETGHLPPVGVGWWEIDVFIGFTAFAMIGICLLVAFRRIDIRDHFPFLGAAGILLMLSLGSIYGAIMHSGIPFAELERVPTRFIIMPFLMVLFTAVRGVDELFRISRKRGRVLVMSGLPFMAHEILRHVDRWRVDRVMDAFPAKVVPELFITPATDSLFVGSVYAGWTVSGLALGLVIVLLLRD